MCGIYGIWNRDGAPVDLARLERATTAIRHRGPDDEGYLLVDTRGGRAVLAAGRDTTPALNLPSLESFAGQRFDLAFGFRRLAILDLSPAGHQPMAGADGRHWIIFNGEIYNYRELRAELPAGFHSQSDTEVILAAYDRWGADCVGRFNGMWAFAIWDAERRELFLSRDRFGIKPLYTVEMGQTFAFASEPKALLAGGLVGFSPSRSAVETYVAAGSLPDPGERETFFEGIRSLPAAHSLRVSTGEMRMDRYWSLPEPSPETGNERKVIDEYRALFVDAIRIHLRSDVPAGTCLSGGLDSSSIVTTVTHLVGQGAQLEGGVTSGLQTFSAVYSDDGPWNERRHIDAVLRATGARGWFVEPKSAGLASELRALVWQQDEPLTSTSMFAQWSVMRLAREHGIKVLLDGQGADEVMAGYHSFYAQYLGERAHPRALAEGLREASRIRSVTGHPAYRWLAKEVVRKVLRRPAMPSLHEALVTAITRDPLPTLLRYEDRNSMAFSIESRVPFLDVRLVEHVFRSGAKLRIRDGWTKWMQREALRGIVPDDVAWRRDKVGFATPERQWMSALGPLSRELTEASPLCDYLDLARLRASRNGSADAPARLEWRILCAAVWLDVFRKAVAA